MAVLIVNYEEILDVYLRNIDGCISFEILSTLIDFVGPHSYMTQTEQNFDDFVNLIFVLMKGPHLVTSILFIEHTSPLSASSIIREMSSSITSNYLLV
jgi:hypothetical protein